MNLLITPKGDLITNDLPMICTGLDAAAVQRKKYYQIGIPTKIKLTTGIRSVMLDLDQEKINRNRKQHNKAGQLPSGIG